MQDSVTRLMPTCVVYAPNDHSNLRLTDRSGCDGKSTHIQVDQCEALQLGALLYTCRNTYNVLVVGSTDDVC